MHEFVKKHFLHAIDDAYKQQPKININACMHVFIKEKCSFCMQTHKRTNKPYLGISEHAVPSLISRGPQIE